MLGATMEPRLASLTAVFGYSYFTRRLPAGPAV